MLQSIKDHRGVALIHQQIGELLLEWKGESEVEAKTHFENAIKVAESHMFSTTAQASYRHLGDMANANGDLDSARKFFEKALHLARQEGDAKGVNVARTGLKETGKLMSERPTTPMVNNYDSIEPVELPPKKQYEDYEDDILNEINLASRIDKVKI